MKIQKGKVERPQKVVIYGPEGIGKTTFGAAFPDALLIDVEQGSGHLDCDRIEVEDWRSFIDTMEELFAKYEELSYKSIVVDTADWLEKLATEYVCQFHNKNGVEDFGFGKGYVYVNEEMIRGLALLDQLRNVGFNVALVAHSQVQKRELPGSQGAFDRYELKCSKRVTALIKEWADAVLFINYKIIVEEGADGKNRARGGTDRLLMTEHTAAFDAKNRWGLESEIPVGDVSDPVPAEILENLSKKKLQAKPKAKKELSPLKALMKKHDVSEKDLKAFLKKQGVKKFTKEIEEKLVAQFDKALVIIKELKKNG